MLYLGKICEVSKEQDRVRVDYLGTITTFIPYLQTANSFKRYFIPPRVGEQVIILKIDGVKIAIGSVFNTQYPKPSEANSQKEICEYEDGTILSYDTKTHTLEILNQSTINIIIKDSYNLNAKQSVNITTTNATINASNQITAQTNTATITAQTTTINSPTIALNGNISTSGSNGSSGTFNIKGDMQITGNIIQSGNLSVSGTISDQKGDLTNHRHTCSDGATALPR